MATQKVALVLGVGPGLGSSLCRLFHKQGMRVAAASRGEKALPSFDGITHYPCDATDPASVEGLVAKVEAELGPIDLAVFNAGAFVRSSILTTSPEDFERCWRVGCMGGFLFGQAVAKRMVERKAGTLIFSGATASLRGSALFANLAVPKFGLRALAQSMARELGPLGVHVGHVVIDGVIDVPGVTSERFGPASQPDARLDPDALATAYWSLYSQQRSAWTFEMDVRPYVEKW